MKRSASSARPQTTFIGIISMQVLGRETYLKSMGVGSGFVAWEEAFGDRDDFIKTFGRSYI